MPPPRRSHGQPLGMPSRCRPSATPSPRSAGRSGARWNYRCPGQARRPSKFPLLCFSAWSTPSATPPDATHLRRFSEMMNRSDQVMGGGKSSLWLDLLTMARAARIKLAELKAKRAAQWDEAAARLVENGRLYVLSYNGQRMRT